MSKADVSEMALKIRLLEERDIEPIGAAFEEIGWKDRRPTLRRYLSEQDDGRRAVYIRSNSTDRRLQRLVGHGLDGPKIGTVVIAERTDTFWVILGVLDDNESCSVCVPWNIKRPLSNISGPARVITDSGVFPPLPVVGAALGLNLDNYLMRKAVDRAEKELV